MKTYSPEEILKYVKRQIAFAEQQKFVYPIVILITTAAVIALIFIMRDLLISLTTEADKTFATGFVIGTLFVLMILMAASGFTKLLRRLKGIEYQAYKRLVELESGKGKEEGKRPT